MPKLRYNLRANWHRAINGYALESLEISQQAAIYSLQIVCEYFRQSADLSKLSSFYHKILITNTFLAATTL